MSEYKVVPNAISFGTVVINMEQFQYAIRHSESEYYKLDSEYTGPKDIVEIDFGFVGKDPITYTFYKNDADTLFEGLRRSSESLKEINLLVSQ